MTATNEFTTADVQYDTEADTLTAVVFLSRDAFGETYTIDKSLETFRIHMDWNKRRFVIEERDESEQLMDFATHYLPSVLAAFAKQFEERYFALSFESSPLDVFDKPVTFNVAP